MHSELKDYKISTLGMDYIHNNPDVKNLTTLIDDEKLKKLQINQIMIMIQMFNKIIKVINNLITLKFVEFICF